MSHPDWGPVEERSDSSDHPLANDVCRGHADPAGVWFQGARIDALIAVAGRVLRTSDPSALRIGIAQVRRAIVTDPLDVLHLVFAPGTPRPLLLSRVQLRNRTPEPLLVNYSELWDVRGENARSAEGACLCDTEDGTRALADVSSALRAHAPEPLPQAGLALDIRLVVPPGELRELSFAYVAPGKGEDPSRMVSAWRGGVAHELARTVSDWHATLGAEPLPAYRRRFAV